MLTFRLVHVGAKTQVLKSTASPLSADLYAASKISTVCRGCVRRSHRGHVLRVPSPPTASRPHRRCALFHSRGAPHHVLTNRSSILRVPTPRRTIDRLPTIDLRPVNHATWYRRSAAVPCPAVHRGHAIDEGKQAVAKVIHHQAYCRPYRSAASAPDDARDVYPGKCRYPSRHSEDARHRMQPVHGHVVQPSATRACENTRPG